MDALLLAYSNHPISPLPTLQDEDDTLYSLFNQHLSKQFRIIRYSSITLESLNENLGAYGKELRVFHYSGHAGESQIHIGGAGAYSSGIAHQLGESARRGKLKLVVLNGCSTAGQVRALLDAGAPVVVATYAPVKDKSAAEFSKRFYRELCENRLTIQSAFEKALGAAQAVAGNLDIKRTGRALDYPDKALEDSHPLWGLFCSGPEKAQLNPFFPYEMRLVQGGAFMRANGSFDQSIQEVQLDDFHIGIYPVTVDLYGQYLKARNKPIPEGVNWDRGKLPATQVSWPDAIRFCNWKSEMEGRKKVYQIEESIVLPDWAADGYRLPTEAEWEFAARGRRQKAIGKYYYAGGSDPDEVAWYKNNSGGRLRPVGQLAPNELGLHDMSGNAWEWCWDWYAEAYSRESPVANPRGPAKGLRRAVRGGCYGSNRFNCRVAQRKAFEPGKGYGEVGFRVVRGGRRFTFNRLLGVSG